MRYVISLHKPENTNISSINFSKPPDDERVFVLL